jgi:hypothetical protein
MAVKYGPSPTIPTSNLVLYLDAANPSSYSGTGTTWFDLSGSGNNATITGTVPFDSTTKVFRLSGITNNFINVPAPNLSGSNFTVICASRYSNIDLITLRIISGLSNNWLIGSWNNANENYFSEGWVSPVGNGGKDTKWRIYAATGNTTTDNYVMWVNGEKRFENGGGSAGPNGFGLGRYAPANTEYTEQGEVSFLLAWNRVLTDAEIFRVTSFFKSRFGL